MSDNNLKNVNHAKSLIPSSILEHVPALIDGDKYKVSAVCIPLIEKPDGFHVLFEVRSSKIDDQPGDVCFPGGMAEEGELPSETAIREACEELMIERDSIELVAASDYILTASRLYIYPFVVKFLDYQNTYSKDEVAEVFTVPLSEILAQKPELHLVNTRTMPGEDFPFDKVNGGRNYKWRVRTEKEIFYQFGDRTIWGLTARLLHAFAKVWGVTYNRSDL